MIELSVARPADKIRGTAAALTFLEEKGKLCPHWSQKRSPLSYIFWQLGHCKAGDSIGGMEAGVRAG